MAIKAATYEEIGGLKPCAALEDEHLQLAFFRCGIPIARLLDIKVATSARLVGRAKSGLARDLALASWVRSYTYNADDFRLRDLLKKKRSTGVFFSAVLLNEWQGPRDGHPTRGARSARGGWATRREDSGCQATQYDHPFSSIDVKACCDVDLMPGFGRCEVMVMRCGEGFRPPVVISCCSSTRVCRIQKECGLWVLSSHEKT